jgi:glycosyltransferase involved in cell wall biosynthesis
VPELKLLTVVTHENHTDRWRYDPPAEINAILFGPGEESSQQGSVRFARHEWHKGGRIIQWLEARDVRAVVVCGYNDLARIRIIFWCRRKGIPCFISGDANILIDNPRGMKRVVKHLVLQPVLRAATGIFPCGRNGEAFFLRYGARPNRIHLFPYEPDIEEIQLLDASYIGSVREQFGLASHRRRIVFSGRLIELKRVDLLIDAFVKTVASARPEWDLLIIGDGPLRNALESLVPGWLRGRVHWTGFLGNQRQVGALYRASDVFAFPSNREQWALVIPEAAAAGLALVVASTVGSAVEFVHDGINGQLFPPDDLPALTRSLLNVTQEGKIEAMKAASHRQLADWRVRNDPVQGLRRALSENRVLKR